MAELNLALGALAQLLSLFLALDLSLHALRAEDVAAWEPFGVLSEYVTANRALKLFVEQLVLLRSQRYCDLVTADRRPAAPAILALAFSSAHNRLARLSLRSTLVDLALLLRRLVLFIITVLTVRGLELIAVDSR